MNKPEIKDCKCTCTCHNDSNVRHSTLAEICCKQPKYHISKEACRCNLEPWHTGCAINPYFLVGINGARITDTKGHVQMKQLQKYTGVVMFGYDPKTKSLDIHFRRAESEWDDGAGIQINNLTDDDKKALKLYLENGK